MRFGKSRKGKRTFTATGDERLIAALEHSLRQNLNPDRPEAPQMYEAFADLLRDGGGVPTAAPRPLVVVPVPEYFKILAGDGDETILGLSDGTTMTGAEFLAQHYGKDLEVGLFHPQAGPVNLYNTKRCANAKPVSYTHLTLPTILRSCRSRWSPYH